MKFVLALSIGPVAHFIAAGRRSRDLWYGSTWLSKTTIEVAKYLRDQPHVSLLAPSESRKRTKKPAEAGWCGSAGARCARGDQPPLRTCSISWLAILSMGSKPPPMEPSV